MKKYLLLGVLLLAACSNQNTLEYSNNKNVDTDLNHVQVPQDEPVLDLNENERKSLAMLLGVTLTQMGRKEDATKIIDEYGKIKDLNKSNVFLYEKYIDAKIDLEQKALSGDYQSQRNTAYAYATDPEKFGGDKVLGCGWYMVILSSGDSKVGVGDQGNVDVYCSVNRLTDDQRAQAIIFAKDIYVKVYKDVDKFNKFYNINGSPSA
ncbi:hypothetical protein [Acinetobacter haemolyticus]|uniref:hypothetical protein n=1 Tax=Acinetobacter haemolyticus TaxID=29430 RepID=UPI0021CD2B58|nr:hypothetical protein [Acinetobacter haemolyticus]MCU4378257.1 hypothetical protein [Acinetobacter haemolyticus]